MKTNPSISTTNPLKVTCIDFIFAYAEHNMDQMMRLCDPNGQVQFVPMGDQGKGTIGELGKTIWMSLIECFPDITNVVHSAVEEDGKIKCKVLISGTQEKDFAGIISKGNRFQSDHVFVFKMNDDQKISNLQIEWDHVDFQKQLER